MGDDALKQAAIARAKKVLSLADDKATQLVEAASQAAVEAWLDMSGGNGAVPSNVSDIQADHLKRTATRLNRIPTEAEVAFLFRTTSSRARLILDRMTQPTLNLSMTKYLPRCA